jgi:hypothetical protein
MISENSHLLSIPNALDKKLIFCLDGIRVSLQTIHLSYTRLSSHLKELSLEKDKMQNIDFTYASLDAWAFIDAVYRLNGLWGVLSKLLILDTCFSKENIDEKCGDVKYIRNVLAHLSQRLDHIVSSNSSIVGEISWLAIKNDNPLLVKTYFVRSGLFYKDLGFKLNLPKDKVTFNEFKVGNIKFNVSGYAIEISEIFNYLLGLVDYLEQLLFNEYQKLKQYEACPLNIFASAEITIVES